jgi:FAD/FMN-containing dehydrogenase
MHMLTTDQILAGAIRGHVSRPGDPDWDSARQAFNLLVDQRPEAVAFPVDEHDVAAVVRHAADRGLAIAPQATGHNAAPLGDLDDTIIVNTSRLQGVTIDAAGRRVRVGAGTKWEAVIEPLSKLGLAALHGSSSDVGIVGYSLGGGLGWLARRYGLQTNSVAAIELVSADGNLIRTDAGHEPELFWALRGGGGNFGVVTAIEFDVYPVSELYAGALFFPFERAAEVVTAWNELAPSLPDEFTTWSSVLHVPDVPFMPEPMRGGSFAAVSGALLGSESAGRRLLASIRALGPAMDTFAMVRPAALAELAMDPADPMPYATAHDSIGEVSAATLTRLIDAVPRESGIAALQLRQLGGAIARPPAGAGARAMLEGATAVFAAGLIVDEASAAAVNGALATLTALTAKDRVRAYPSFVEVPTDASTFFDSATWSRLREVKALYDPRDLFRGNHHIPAAR